MKTVGNPAINPTRSPLIPALDSNHLLRTSKMRRRGNSTKSLKIASSGQSGFHLLFESKSCSFLKKNIFGNKPIDQSPSTFNQSSYLSQISQIIFVEKNLSCTFPPTHRSFSSPVFSPFCVFLQSVFFSTPRIFFQSVFFCNVACSTFQLPCCGQLDKKGEARFVQGICSRSTLTSVFYLAHLYHPRHLSQHHHCDHLFLCPLLSLIQEYDCDLNVCNQHSCKKFFVECNTVQIGLMAEVNILQETHHSPF